MKKQLFAHGQELPLGLSMALAQVPAAYAYFAKLDPLQRQQIIDSAHCIWLQRGNAWSSQQLVKLLRSLIQVFSEQS